MARAAALWLTLALPCLGCDDLDQFSTGDDAIFRGDIVGGNPAADEPNSFILSGFQAGTRMELEFDPDAAADVFSLDSDDDVQLTQAAEPGSVTTCLEDPCRDPDGELNGPGQFDRAALEPISQLAHDPLSQYEFPGGGRIRNYIFGARFVTDAIKRHAMVFVSLLENGRIEVRVIAPSVLDEEGEEQHPSLFGLFRLDRERKNPS